MLAPTELLTAAAAWTSTLTLGTSILVAGNHWPAPLAQRLATIDLPSEGRLAVGLGVGWNAEEHDARARRSPTEALAWTTSSRRCSPAGADDPVSYEGPFSTIPPSVIRPKPVPRPRPMLLSGMWSPSGIERTRLHFDAWNPAGLPVDRVASTADSMNAIRPAVGSASRCGRDSRGSRSPAEGIHHIEMLEACFLLFRVEAERPSEHKVVIAHPRLFATDVGFAAWAARNTHEVDLVLVHPGGRLVAIEVKASTSVGPADAQGLARFAASDPEGLVRGIVVYEGSRVLTLSAPGDHQILAVPRSLL